MNRNPDARPTIDLIASLKSNVQYQSRLPAAICFDYFDTLVFRTVPPEHTKKIAARQLARLLNGILGDTLYDIRRHLERTLCSQNITQKGDPEFNLIALGVEIYHILKRMYPNSRILASEDRFVRFFCSIEIAVEKQVQPHMKRCWSCCNG